MGTIVQILFTNLAEVYDMNIRDMNINAKDVMSI